MAPFTNFLEGVSGHSLQWRYDRLNQVIAEKQGQIDIESARLFSLWSRF